MASSGPYAAREADSGGRAPPRYSTLTVATLPGYPVAEELDIGSDFGDDNSSLYTSRRRFDFATKSSNDSTPWLSFHLTSNAPPSSLRPRFIGGENVEGAVTLNLERPQTISSIVVLLRGRLVTSALNEGSHMFLEHSHPIWKAGTDSYHIPTPDESGLTGEMIKGKFSGEFELPFSFPFPTEFSTTSKKGASPATHTTPQTLVERGIYATVVYQVILKVTGGGFLRNTTKVVADVLYIPYIRSPDLPLLRSQAYQQGLSLMSPLRDAPGWTALPSFTVRVRQRCSQKDTQSNNTTDAVCTVYVANPTIYTRGTVIPCYILCTPLEASDSSTDNTTAASLIDALASNGSISASLVQTVSFGNDVSNSTSFGHAALASTSGRRTTRTMAEAVWWSPSSVPGHVESGSQRLPHAQVEGEIHLPRGLLPSCENSFLSISYAVRVHISQSRDLVIERLSKSAQDEPNQEQLARAYGQPSISHQERTSTMGGTRRSQHDNAKLVSSISVGIATVKGRGPLPVPFTPAPPPRVHVEDVGANVEPVGMGYGWQSGLS